MLLGTLVPLALGACSTPTPGPAGDAPRFEAREVELEVPLAGGQLVARGARLTLADGGTTVRLEGDASVRVQGARELEARAERLTADLAARQVELAGAVRARIALEGAADAGI